MDEFLELVQIDSETKFERKIADALKAKFQALGLEVFEDESAKVTGHEAGNLICRLTGTVEDVPTIFFTAHMDTVLPGKGVQPAKEGEDIVSDGPTILGADDKAGIAAILETIRMLQEGNIPHGDIEFIITSGEESGVVGAKALDIDLVQASYGYAIDSSGPVGEIVISAPTQARLHIDVQGKTAHAGLAPEKGISAITLAANAISKMNLGRIDEETTANIGKFYGGEQTNIVCDIVHIQAEARSLQKEKMELQVEHMKTTFEKKAKE